MARTVKVQCGCGARFAFEVEPVEGRMPVPVRCPVCGTDATEQATRILAGEADAGPQVSGASERSGTTLRLRRPETPGGTVEPAAREADEGETAPLPCPQHPGETAVEHCRVCGKPICHRCMELHGYTCSVLCRGRAEREGIQLPVYPGERRIRQARKRRLLRWAGLAAAAVVFAWLGYAAWWRWVGSRPRVLFSHSVSTDRAEAWDLVDGDHLLSWTGTQAALRSLPDGRVLWRLSFQAAGNEELPQLVSTRPWLCWLQGGRLGARDRAAGRVRWAVELPMPLTQVRWNDRALVGASERADGSAEVWRVDLDTGATWRQRIPARPVTIRPVSPNGGGASRTAARVPTASDANRWLEEEEAREAPLPPPQRWFVPAGEGVAEFQWWMMERNIVEREGMRPREGRSVLEDEHMTAGRSWQSVGQALNQIERIRSGGVVREDRSRYGIRLWRWRGEPAQVWTGEGIGRPWFVSLRTVDVIGVGTHLTVLDRQNRVRWTATLAFDVSEEVLEEVAAGRGDGPCLEWDDRLLVFDRGMLTCFDSQTGRVNWRLPSVGILRVVPDGRGALYVSSTTATVEDLKYPLEIRLWDKARPLILKVDAHTGREIWRRVGLADRCHWSDPVLYAWWFARGMSGEGTFFHLYRLDPARGEPRWHLYEERWPRRLAFQGRRLLLQWEDAVEGREFRYR